MAVYYGRLEDISIKLLKTAKTTFKNVANAILEEIRLLIKAVGFLYI
ncbi:hypothetical protein [Streptococcus oralis]|nr:hypothetical protein [Streptococcus oralis]MCY7095807.1 hypothetical protein [Streptococcus oralis]